MLQLGVVPKVVRGTETSCNLLKHRTPINRAKLADMKVKKVPNLLTTDQKVGGSSPSKRTETQEAFTTSWASSFLTSDLFVRSDQYSKLDTSRQTSSTSNTQSGLLSQNYRRCCEEWS